MSVAFKRGIKTPPKPFLMWHFGSPKLSPTLPWWQEGQIQPSPALPAAASPTNLPKVPFSCRRAGSRFSRGWCLPLLRSRADLY